jgi:hypothetical protein
MNKGIRFTKGFRWDPVAKMVEHGYPNPHKNLPFGVTIWQALLFAGTDQ